MRIIESVFVKWGTFMKPSGKKIVGILCACALVVIVAFVALLLQREKSVQLGDLTYERDITTLDLSGGILPEIELLQQFPDLRYLDVRDTEITPDGYETLKSALPMCDIRWSVPVCGDYFDSESEMIDISVLTEDDIPLLAYLPCLTSVDAEDCSDYDALLALQKVRGDGEKGIVAVSFSLLLLTEKMRGGSPWQTRKFLSIPGPVG